MTRYHITPVEPPVPEGDWEVLQHLTERQEFAFYVRGIWTFRTCPFPPNAPIPDMPGFVAGESRCVQLRDALLLATVRSADYEHLDPDSYCWLTTCEPNPEGDE